MSLTAKDIAEIARLLDQSHFTSLDLQMGDFRLRIRRDGGWSARDEDDEPATPAPRPAPASSEPPPPIGQEAGAARVGEIDVPAPLLGNFYSAPRPGDPPFVEPGDAVGEDTTIGIIEVMKLMNPIRAGVRGTVVALLAVDGSAVEEGQPLLRVRLEGLTMATLQIVETSLRDGNQCLWGALGVTTANTLTIAPAMERAGYRAIDFTTSTHMGVAVRYKQEDPWERIRAMAEICRNTPLQFLSTGFRFIAWETASPEFMELAFRTLARNGIRRFALADPMNDAVSNVEVARLVKRSGGEQVVGALVYTISPIHDDAHYAAAARTMAASPDIEALYIKDPGGLLTAQRARTLIPAILAEIGDKPLELHNHCTIGLAEPACLEAAELGVAAVQCASGGAADGTSNPPIQRMIANLRALGHTVEIDDEAVAEVAQYFTALAEAEGLPTGHPMAFDAAYLRHQLPGGMVGTMRRHLADHGVPQLEGAVIEEMGRVREELGWPIVMTPFAQMLQTQAMLNVTGKERYGVIPDEVIRYAIGRFGRPNVPIAGETLDRIMANPRTKELQAEPGMAELSDLRRRIGANLSDEEFLLRATMPANLVDAMQAAGPAEREYDPAKVPVMNLLREVLRRTDVTQISVEKTGFKLEVAA